MLPWMATSPGDRAWNPLSSLLVPPKKKTAKGDNCGPKNQREANPPNKTIHPNAQSLSACFCAFFKKKVGSYTQCCIIMSKSSFLGGWFFGWVPPS